MDASGDSRHQQAGTRTRRKRVLGCVAFMISLVTVMSSCSFNGALPSIGATCSVALQASNPVVFRRHQYHIFRSAAELESIWCNDRKCCGQLPASPPEVDFDRFALVHLRMGVSYATNYQFVHRAVWVDGDVLRARTVIQTFGDGGGMSTSPSSWFVVVPRHVQQTDSRCVIARSHGRLIGWLWTFGDYLLSGESPILALETVVPD
jgi:hypothetical protein